MTTDNGGMTIGMKETGKTTGAVYSVSSNFPLRAGKATMFEGGVRGVAFVTGGFLPNKTFGSKRTGLLQHVDIPQTIAALAGTTIPGSDGYNVWNYIVSNGESPRSEVPVNIDTCVGMGVGGPPCTSSTSSALIMGNWKLISVSKYPGPNVAYDGWWSNEPYINEHPTQPKLP